MEGANPSSTKEWQRGKEITMMGVAKRQKSVLQKSQTKKKLPATGRKRGPISTGVDVVAENKNCQLWPKHIHSSSKKKRTASPAWVVWGEQRAETARHQGKCLRRSPEQSRKNLRSNGKGSPSSSIGGRKKFKGRGREFKREGGGLEGKGLGRGRYLAM